MDGSAHPVIFSADDLPDGFPGLCSGIAIPHSGTTRQNTLYGATVKVHKPSCAYAAFPEAP